MKRSTAILLAGAALVWTLPAMAQSAESDQATADRVSPAESGGRRDAEGADIVVTARRREERLMDIPGAIFATTGAELINSGVSEIAELQFAIPGFFTDSGLGYSQAFIRGIGNNIQVGADPSVATYIDDVPRLAGSLVDSFVNVERIEVLKGAQGGLYGRNATGGVIAIATRQPADTLGGEARISYGEYNTLRIGTYLNVPLSEGLAWNIAVQREVGDGKIDNLAKNPAPYTADMFPDDGTPGSLGGVNVNPFGTGAAAAAYLNSGVDLPGDLGDRDFWAVDSKLRFQSGDFTLTLAGDWSRKRDSNGNVWYNPYPPAIRNLVLGLIQRFTGIRQTCGPTFSDACNAVNLPADFIRDPAGKYKTYAPSPSKAYLEDYGGSAIAKLMVGETELTSITSYRELETLYRGDTGPDIVPSLAPAINNRRHDFYQEVRATSTGSGPLSYIFGATYLRSEFKGDSNAFILGVIQTPKTLSDAKTRNWSIYAELGYDVTPQINVTVSGRYLHEKTASDFTSPTVSSASVSASKFLPSATVTYALPGGGNIFARYAKGFKAGGINLVNPPSVFPTDYGKVFKPESVDSYEAGFKLPLADRAVYLTGNVFYNDYVGLQTNTIGNPSYPLINFAVINAGGARTYGADGTLDWKVSSSLSLDASLGYLNARYKNFRNTDGTVLNVFDFSHQRMLFAPKWQASIGGNLDHPLSDGIDLTGTVRASYLSDIKLTNSPYPNLPNLYQDGYWLVNARVGLQSADDSWDVALFADNLFNVAYSGHGSSGSAGNKWIWGSPRMMGVEARIKF